MSGADLSTALRSLHLNSTKKLKKVYGSIYEDLIKGVTLSEAFERTGKFDAFEVVSIEIGEGTGLLGEVFSKLSKSMERSLELKRQIISVATYPLFLLIITSGILVFMLYAVVPTFEDLYARFDTELPEITKVVLQLSELVSLPSILISIIITISSVSVIYKQKETLWFRRLLSRSIKAIPVLGKLYEETINAQYFAYFSLMINSGIPLNSALEYLSGITDHFPLKEDTIELKKMVEAGESLSQSMMRFKSFDSYTAALVELGEQSNSLGKVFDNISEQYQSKSSFSLKTFGSLIEPVMIVLIAGVIATVLLAMYLPIFKLSSGI